MNALPEIVSKLIPRLASNHDGEIVATARAIDRALKANRLDWHDLTRAITAPLPPPPPPFRAESSDVARTRAWLEAVLREPWPNNWERNFIESVLSQPLARLSEKQTACVNKIITEARRRGVRMEEAA
jgi:hypothetical protein